MLVRGTPKTPIVLNGKSKGYREYPVKHYAFVYTNALLDRPFRGSSFAGQISMLGFHKAFAITDVLDVIALFQEGRGGYRK